MTQRAIRGAVTNEGTPSGKVMLRCGGGWQEEHRQQNISCVVAGPTNWWVSLGNILHVGKTPQWQHSV